MKNKFLTGLYICMFAMFQYFFIYCLAGINYALHDPIKPFLSSFYRLLNIVTILEVAIGLLLVIYNVVLALKTLLKQKDIF